jgi:hypothetical protein
VGAQSFEGYYDNTDLSKRLMSILNPGRKMAAL